jgi:hypothetical protein
MSNLDEFKGHLPYASELMGVFQPLLGWEAQQTARRISDERLRTVNRVIEGMLGDPRLGAQLEQASGRAHATTPPPNAPTWLTGLVGQSVLGQVHGFVKDRGRTPTAKEWGALLHPRVMENTLRKADGALLTRARLIPGTPAATKAVPAMAMPDPRGDLVAQRTREVVIAGALSWLGKRAPHVLSSILLGTKPDWEAGREFVDPLEDADPAIVGAVLSPVGVIHLYRQFFFEFDTFLGPPVGHVWISPGGSVELVEISTRRVLVDRMMEILSDTTTKSERTVTLQDELADAIKTDNDNNTQVGASVNGGATFPVWHAEGSASFGLNNTNRLSQERTHREMRQQSERLTSEIRRSYHTTFRQVEETTDTSSRKYVVQNTTNSLVNYELRRKMRKVGVQVQHVGTQLCWQVFVDDAGAELGLGELVHVAKPTDATGDPPPPDAPAQLATKENDVTVDFPFSPTTNTAWGDADYVNGVRDGNNESEKIVSEREYSATPPDVGYTLATVNIKSFRGTTPGKWDPKVTPSFTVQASSNSFKITLSFANFYTNKSIEFTVKLIWNPPDQAEALKASETKIAELTNDKARKEYVAYVNAVRERVKLASNIKPRPIEDLRDEERTAVFRRLLQQLMNVGPRDRPHVTSELVRGLFDVDKMLYFVAPEWWQPHTRVGQSVLATTVGPDGHEEVQPLTAGDTIGWGGIGAVGRPNYLITEDSDPARLGSSLGWLLQLDGDDRRNAFLNSPWVKAVIPIRPGRERAALRWLELARVEGSDGLDAKYGGPEPSLRGKTIRQALHQLAEEIATLNTDEKNVLAVDRLYEKGFDPLEKGFQATGKPFELYDQWIEVLPTDQVVAVDYKAAI